MIAIVTQNPLLARMLQLEVERGGFSTASPEEATLLLCDAPGLAASSHRPAVIICFDDAEKVPGAHHTLPLPYSTEALQSLLRRYHKPGTLLPLPGGVLLCGRFVSLSPTEERLLRLLLQGGGEAVPEAVLRTALPSEGDGSNLLQVLLCRLRRKLSPDGISRIRSLRGRGYVLVTEAPSPCN